MRGAETSAPLLCFDGLVSTKFQSEHLILAGAFYFRGEADVAEDY
jgi:hypothetical protein